MGFTLSGSFSLARNGAFFEGRSTIDRAKTRAKTRRPDGPGICASPSPSLRSFLQLVLTITNVNAVEAFIKNLRLDASNTEV